MKDTYMYTYKGRQIERDKQLKKEDERETERKSHTCIPTETDRSKQTSN